MKFANHENLSDFQDTENAIAFSRVFIILVANFKHNKLLKIYEN